MSREEVDHREPLHENGVVKVFTASSASSPLVHTFDELGYHTVTLDVVTSDG